jgi:catechol 2,3-dioxygenase-like lactoylglutathione lyase family enzyme
VPKPLFTDILHAAVIVRDLDAAVRTYNDDYGIGPWYIYEFGPDTVENMTRDGKPAEFAWRLALAQVGGSFIELIQPLDDRSSYAEFLEAHGEGIHHIAFRPANHDAVEADLRQKGLAHVQGGIYKGIRFDYFSTEGDLGFISELLDLPEGPPRPTPSIHPRANRCGPDEIRPLRRGWVGIGTGRMRSGRYGVVGLG